IVHPHPPFQKINPNTFSLHRTVFVRAPQEFARHVTVYRHRMILHCGAGFSLLFRWVGHSCPTRTDVFVGALPPRFSSRCRRFDDRRYTVTLAIEKKASEQEPILLSRKWRGVPLGSFCRWY